MYRIQRLQDNNICKCSSLYLIIYSYSLNENYNSGEFCHHRLFCSFSHNVVWVALLEEEHEKLDYQIRTLYGARCVGAHL